MKIALLSPLPPFRGGISQFGSRLLETLSSTGNEVIGVNYSKLYPDLLFPGRTQLEDRGTEPAGLLHGYNPLKWARASGQLKEMNPDVVISQWWHPFFAFCLNASIPRGARTAAVCHNIVPHEAFPFSGALAQSFLKKQDLLVVHSADAEKQGKGLGANVLRLFHPVYDQYTGTGLPRDEARKLLGLQEHHIALLFFGLVREYKGLDILMEACEMLPDNFRIIAAGENYTRHSYSSERMLWRNEFIPGNEVGTWFNASDMVVLPYRTASQSGIAQIAMAFEKPIVATPVGGLPETVDQGITGFISRNTSPGAVAEAILKCASLAGAGGTASAVRKKAGSFSWETYASKLIGAVQ